MRHEFGAKNWAAPHDLRAHNRHENYRGEDTLGGCNSQTYGLQTYNPQTSIQAKLSAVFIGYRRALAISDVQAARHLHTSPNVIAALEAGAIEHLPDWPETERIVRQYSSFVGCDPGPVLSALADAWHGMAPTHAPVFAPPPPPSPLIDARRRGGPSPVSEPAVSRRPGQSQLMRRVRLVPRRTMRQVRQRPVRALYTLTLPLGLLVIILNLGLFSPLTGPIRALTHDVRDAIAVAMAPVHDGHKWIEVSDPRTRRGDKLHSAGH